MADERIFSDPAFQGWVKSIVYEARRTFTSVPDRTLDEIEKANKAPSGLSSKPELLSIVETIYREIVDDGELSYLDLSAQSFASDFRLWGEPSDIFGRVSAESEGAAGSEEGLDIVDGIHAIASEAERISRFVTSSYLREYLSSVAEKLASISSDGYADPSEVIRSVEVLGREVENVSQIMERAEGSRLGAVIPNVLQSAMLAREKAAQDEVEDLERAIWLLERHLELGKFGYRMRELTIEVQMRALDILRRLGPGDSIVVPNDEVLTSSPFDFVDVGDGDPEVEAGKLAQRIFEQGRKP
ncbi:MAG TPA: hypothetical protein PLZ86_06675, partial [bacterium]|nr:hypothetical protein [bacterium]